MYTGSALQRYASIPDLSSMSTKEFLLEPVYRPSPLIQRNRRHDLNDPYWHGSYYTVPSQAYWPYASYYNFWPYGSFANWRYINYRKVPYSVDSFTFHTGDQPSLMTERISTSSEFIPQSYNFPGYLDYSSRNSYEYRKRLRMDRLFG